MLEQAVKVTTIVKKLVELSTNREWAIIPVIERYDFEIKYRCLDDDLVDVPYRVSQCIEERDWLRVQGNHSFSENETANYFATYIAYGIHSFFWSTRYDKSKEKLGIRE